MKIAVMSLWYRWLRKIVVEVIETHRDIIAKRIGGESL